MIPRALTLCRFLAAAWAIPAVLSCAAYYGFASNYSLDKFSPALFHKHYDGGVYKYRVLGREITVAVADFIDSHRLPVRVPNLFRAMGEGGSPALYAAHFLVNTLFLCLACSVLFLLLLRLLPPAQSHFSYLLLLFFALLSAMTQYVITPYDSLSNCLFVCAAALILVPGGPARFALLLFLTMLSTLTRESSALILSFYLAINAGSILVRRGPTRNQLELATLVFAFLLPYLLLRFLLGTKNAAYEEVVAAHMLHSPLSLLGLIFLLAFLFLFLADARNRKPCALFILASLPYLVPMLFVAYLWEIRLWVPVILGLMLIKIKPVNASPAASPA